MHGCRWKEVLSFMVRELAARTTLKFKPVGSRRRALGELCMITWQVALGQPCLIAFLCAGEAPVLAPPPSPESSIPQLSSNFQREWEQGRLLLEEVSPACIHRGRLQPTELILSATSVTGINLSQVQKQLLEGGTMLRKHNKRKWNKKNWKKQRTIWKIIPQGNRRVQNNFHVFLKLR